MQKIENLEITKVAFVPEGDNKKADVLLFKSKPEDTPKAPTEEKEASVMKRVLLAIGKALGFDEGESATEPKSPENQPVDDPPELQKTDPEKTVEEGCGKQPNAKKSKGEQEDMKIDKSKLTPEEIAALDAIEKKAGIQEDPTPATDPVAKNAPAAPAANEPEDIYKGLHPAIKAELESLRKTAERLEDRELTEVAKKYEIIGKKAEELVPLFKSLKTAGGDAYDQMITVLDASVEAFEKSGIFKEVGKKGSGTPDAWSAIEKHADEIMKSAPNTTRAQAIDKACEQHPELVAEYEKNC